MKKLCLTLLLPVLLAAPAAAQPAAAQAPGSSESVHLQLSRVLATLTPVPAPALAAGASADEPQVLLSTAPEGHVIHLGAPIGYAFSAAGLAGGRPELTAATFLREHAVMLGAPSPAVDWELTRLNPGEGRHYARMNQTYGGIPFVAGEVVVQMNLLEDIEAVLADVAHSSLEALDAGRLDLRPAVTSEGAAALARAHFAGRAAGMAIEVTPPRLSIFAPEVLDEEGEPQLVWDFLASCEDAEHVAHRTLVDAHSGAVARAWALSCNALNRRIYDGSNNNTTSSSPVLRRSEGQGATGVAQVDRCYVHIGETYNFFWGVHSRDSYDGAGARIEATVRFCSTGCGCPCVNAFSGNANSETSRMVYGNGFVTDDIVAHEFTHRVTQLTSGLIYTNTSGAINESFSDIWGEFVDLVNNSQGNDAANVRWLMGEDLSVGWIRNMADPPARNHPDRLNSTFWQPPSNTNDFGGVHRNSGVGNKLAYLLTDGDTFNGQTVFSHGITNVARLFYEAQVNLLTSGANYFNLGNALRQAAVNRGWSHANQNNLYRACLAVEIIGSPSNFYVDRVIAPCALRNGSQTCVIFSGPWMSVTEGVNNMPAGHTLRVRGSTYTESLTIRKAMTIRNYNGDVTIRTP